MSRRETRDFVKYLYTVAAVRVFKPPPHPSGAPPPREEFMFSAIP